MWFCLMGKLGKHDGSSRKTVLGYNGKHVFNKDCWRNWARVQYRR